MSVARIDIDGGLAFKWISPRGDETHQVIANYKSDETDVPIVAFGQLVLIKFTPDMDLAGITPVDNTCEPIRTNTGHWNDMDVSIQHAAGGDILVVVSFGYMTRRDLMGMVMVIRVHRDYTCTLQNSVNVRMDTRYIGYTYYAGTGAIIGAGLRSDGILARLGSRYGTGYKLHSSREGMLLVTAHVDNWWALVEHNIRDGVDNVLDCFDRCDRIYAEYVSEIVIVCTVRNMLSRYHEISWRLYNLVDGTCYVVW